MPFREVLGAFVLRDTALRVTDFGTSVTEPQDYWPHVEAFAVLRRVLGRARADRRGRTRRVGGRGEDRAEAAVPQDRGMERRAKIDAGAYVYFTFLRPFAELAGVDDRLDRAPRQHRPLPVPGARRRRDRAATRRSCRDARDPTTCRCSFRRGRWLLDFATRSDGIAGFVRLELRDDEVAWFWAYLVGVPGVDGVSRRARPRGAAAAPGPRDPRRRSLGGADVRDAAASTGRSGSRRSACGSTGPPSALRAGGEIGDRIAVGLDIEWEVADGGPPGGTRARRRAGRSRPLRDRRPAAGSTTTGARPRRDQPERTVATVLDPARRRVGRRLRRTPARARGDGRGGRGSAAGKTVSVPKWLAFGPCSRGGSSGSTPLRRRPSRSTRTPSCGRSRVSGWRATATRSRRAPTPSVPDRTARSRSSSGR